MKSLDLFSGIGGFSLGFERAGIETVAFVEQSEFCQKVLRKRWPEVPVYDDVSRYRGDEHKVDIVCGGFPCQDISIAGEGKGLDGERSGLWFEMLRIIRKTRPKYVVVENVPMLRSRGLNTVLGGLAQSGFDAEWHCIRASTFGAPQPRERIWIIAYPRGLRTTGLLQSLRACADGRWWPGGEEALLALSKAPFVHGDRHPQPLLRGVDGRVPNRVDRVRACGNSIIPKIAQKIGEEIQKAEKE